MKISSYEPISNPKYENGYQTRICNFRVHVCVSAHATWKNNVRRTLLPVATERKKIRVDLIWWCVRENMNKHKRDERTGDQGDWADLTANGGRAHYIIESKVQWKPFWLATPAVSTE